MTTPFVTINIDETTGRFVGPSIHQPCTPAAIMEGLKHMETWVMNLPLQPNVLPAASTSKAVPPPEKWEG